MARMKYRQVSVFSILLTLSALFGGLILAGMHPAMDPVMGFGDETRPGATVILVRHAETAQSTKTTRDPELSEAGKERAESLARLLSGAGVGRLFSSEFQRTQATLAPLAERRGLEVETIPAGEPEKLVSILRGLPAGMVAVIAGHSNTVPGLVHRLGGRVEDLVEDERYGPMLRSSEYDRLFVVQLPLVQGATEGGGVATLELRYGCD